MVGVITVEKIKELNQKYEIRNGQVYSRDTNQQVMDEDTVLQIKAARLIYNEAREKSHSDFLQFGKVWKKPEQYIYNYLERYGVNGDINDFPQNSVYRSLLDNDGHFECNYLGDTLDCEKFGMFYGKKQEYGISLLRLKFREKGFDIDDFSIKIDTSEFKKNGYSTVIIDFKKKPYKKEDKQSINIHSLTGDEKLEYAKKQLEKAQANGDLDMISYWQTIIRNSSSYRHPKANVLNELEAKKQEARQDNDHDAFNYYQENIVSILEKNQAQVSPEEWEHMSYDQKRSFMLVKMKEAKALDDKDMFNYWASNIVMLDANQESSMASATEIHK